LFLVGGFLYRKRSSKARALHLVRHALMGQGLKTPKSGSVSATMAPATRAAVENYEQQQKQLSEVYLLCFDFIDVNADSAVSAWFCWC
jgi:hypothetical protein